MSADTVPVDTINKAIDGDLDSLIVAVRALEIPLKHELALRYLVELQQLRAENQTLRELVPAELRPLRVA